MSTPADILAALVLAGATGRAVEEIQTIAGGAFSTEQKKQVAHVIVDAICECQRLTNLDLMLLAKEAA